MVATFDPNLRVTEQGTNDNPNTWGAVLNQQVIALLCASIAGVQQIDFSGGVDIDISTSALIPPNNNPGVANGATDTARNAVLELTSAITPLSGTLHLTVPSLQKVYIIRGAQTGGNILVKCSGGSSTVTVSPGSFLVVYTNGTSIYSMGANGLLAAANNLSDLLNIVTARTNLGLGSAAVLNAGVSANNAVQLGSDGKLPALDGSKLLNVVGTPAGVGTAAFLNVGTVAGDVVQLNGSGQLPAVDGSLLTGILTGAGGAAGHIALAGLGVTLQWGRYDTNTPGAGNLPALTFPVAFSGTPYFIGGTTIETVNYLLVVPKLTWAAGGCTPKAYSTASTNLINCSYCWFAIGPT